MRGWASTRSTTLASSPTPEEKVNQRSFTRPEVHPARLEVVGHPQQVLGGVHHVGGDAQRAAEDVRGAARQDRSAGVSEPARPLAASFTVPSPPKASTTS